MKSLLYRYASVLIDCTYEFKQNLWYKCGQCKVASFTYLRNLSEKIVRFDTSQESMWKEAKIVKGSLNCKERLKRKQERNKEKKKKHFFF